MKNNVILISKDVLRPDYLPVYGNDFWKTPNIDALASKGTVFKRHYTVAPSTAMAFTSMFTGLYPYETNRATYVEINSCDISNSTILFDDMYKSGYECHLVWSKNYIHMAEKFSRCYGEHTIHHDKLQFNQSVGPHYKFGTSEIERNDDETARVYQQLMSEINSINCDKPIFLWVHMPHVFSGRTAYGDDIDIFDRFVGDIRLKFGDNIYITGDHGSCNGKDGKTGYGFDLMESAIRIPLISPKIDSLSEVTYPTTNAQLKEIILNRAINQREYIVADTAYYEQPHRKICLVKDNYKYIFEKESRREKLYDISFDPNENVDLLSNILVDKDRGRKVVAKQVLWYPYWNEVLDMRDYFVAEFNKIWREGSWCAEVKNRALLNGKKVRWFIKTMHK